MAKTYLLPYSYHHFFWKFHQKQTFRNRTQIYGSERKTKFTKRGVQRTKTNIKKKAIVDIQDGESIDFYNNL